MEYGMKDFCYGMEMEWKKIASMEYRKIVFHSIPYHALAPCLSVKGSGALICQLGAPEPPSCRLGAPGPLVVR